LGYGFSHEEWLSLHSFLRTYPKQRRLLKYLHEHADQEHTVESLNRDSPEEIVFLDLKALLVHKLLSARNRDGRPVSVPLHLEEGASFRLLPEKKALIQAVLEERQVEWEERANRAAEG